tara:strand:- start:2103 stop:3026 length:924 start_codon:yes stop_codon:yes gene_type:complete
MKLIKKGSKGDEVKRLQSILKIQVDGHFGPQTEKAVIAFQLSRDLKPDGIVGNNTWGLLIHGNNVVDTGIGEDTDTNSQYFETRFGQRIHRHHLSKGEYLENKPGKNEYFFLHHTAGGSDPYRCIDHWNRDSRGRVATEFVLGGQNYRNGDDEHDGIMVQAFPETGYGWHLGKTGSGYMNRHSIGIEICSIGYLDSEHKSYVGKKAIESQVIELDTPFRRKKFWHKYSDKQMEEVHLLLKFIEERDQIDMRIGLQQWIKKYGPTKAFDFHQDACDGKVKGLLSHTSVRKTKMDVYPDPRLVDIIMSF